MIISCPSCETQFRVDETLFPADGKKVRCSKCGHVWRAMLEGQPASLAEPPEPVAPPVAAPVADASPEETPQAEQSAEQVEPVLSARDETGREDSGGDMEDPGEAESPEEESGPDGLTEEQRAKLAAARQQKPPSRLRTKVLFGLVVVAVLLLLALYTVPPDVLNKVKLGSQQPANVGEIDAKPASAGSQ